MLSDLDRLLQALNLERAVLVTVDATQGSVPRERGAWMAVLRGEVIGTVGGGHLEFDAMAQARALLDIGGASFVRRYPLGPSLGQCCGGVVDLRFELVQAKDLDMLRQRLLIGTRPLAIFGGGHVGRALVGVFSRLPFSVTWIDSRDKVFPDGLPSSVACEHSDPVQRAVPHLAAGSAVLILSFSHAEDLEVVAQCLMRLRERNDLSYVGLIGSKTKWATFRHRLEARGFAQDEMARITSPIGLPGIRGKEPEVIAVSVAAQLLMLA